MDLIIRWPLSFQPSIVHANLRRNEIIEFSVSPILSKYYDVQEAAVLEGELIASGGGGAVELPVSFDIPAGWGIYYGDPPGIAATIWNKIKCWFCPNKPCVDTEVSIDPNVNGGSLTVEQIKTVLVTLVEGIATDPDPTGLSGIGISLIKTADVNTCAIIKMWCNIEFKKALKKGDLDKAVEWQKLLNEWSKRTPKPKMKKLGMIETQSADPISIIPDGEVYVKIDTEWEPCERIEIEVGEIKTEANSRAFLVCGGSTAEIREQSHFMIVQSFDTPTFYQEIELFNGSAQWHVLWGDFKANTPDAVLSVTNVDAFDNTDAAFDVEIIGDGTIIEVYRGSIDVTRRGNATASHVSRGYRATVSDEGIEIAEFELPRRTHIEGIPNIEDVKLIIDFSLPWDRRTYRNHDVDVLINDNLVGQIKNSIPEGQYIFVVDPSYLNYGENEAAKNIITLDTKHLNGGHYVVNAGMELLFRCTSLEIPIIASSQNEADRLSKELEYINWDGADLAVYTNSIALSNPSPVQGEAVTINATVYNIGVPPLSDVEVKFYDNEVEIGSKIIPYIYSSETIGIVWNTSSGWHNLSIKVNPDRVIEEIDYTNNEASKTISVTGPDTTPPIISNPQPPDGSTTSDNMTLISADLADADSGVNTNAVRLVVDGTDVTQSANAISSCIWYTPEHALTAGVHNVSVYAADNEGNRNSLNWSFTVQTGITSYDLNGDNNIDKEEALKAVSDYLVYNKISKDLAIEVVKAYLLNPGVVFALAEGTSMREVSNSNPDPGEVVTVAIKSPEIGGFYAVKEDIDGLEYMGKHTADSKEPEEMIFIMLQAKGFNYTVKVPEAAKPGDEFVITGKFWNDPAAKKEIGKTVLTVAGAPTPEMAIYRGVSSEEPSPGEVVTVSLEPSGIETFYAVKEDIDGLEYMGEHTADSKEQEEMIFIMLQAKGFNYTVKVPEAAKPGDEFIITGKFWNDPAAKKEIGKTVLNVADASQIN